jgi:hypothetical protein
VSLVEAPLANEGQSRENEDVEMARYRGWSTPSVR